MGEVVDVILNIIIGRLPGKFRIAGKAIMKLLDLVGQRQAVFDAVAAAIPEKVDPNRHWRKVRDEKIAVPLATARDEIVTEIFKVLGEFEVFKKHIDKLEAKKAGLTTGRVPIGSSPEEPENDAEVKPLLSDVGARLVRPGVAVALPGDAGQPLPQPARRSFERGFGQDFGHVRVHADAAAASAAGRVGARALTSGSHVYLGAGSTPRAGAPVLAHELAHVVQQTGSRPLGGTHPRAPVPGRPGRGLVIDARHEAAADAAAGRLGGHVRGGGADGVQPSMPLGLIGRIIDRATSTSDIESDADKAAKSSRPDKVPDGVRKRVPIKPFIDELASVAQRELKFDYPFEKVQGLLKKHLQRGEGGFIEAVENALDDVLLDSIVVRKPPKNAKPSGQAPPPEYVLDPKRFKVALARVILGETGLVLDIDLKSAGDDAPVSVVGLKVVYVHLPPIHATSNNSRAIWERATVGLVLLDELPVMRPKIRAYLEGTAPSNAIWERAEFRLKRAIVDEVRAGMVKGALDPSDLPSIKDYVDPDLPGSKVGLRLGTHAGLTSKPLSERESHHISQFLLVDYFTNNTSPPAFPLIAATPEAYPALKAESGLPHTFNAPNEKPMPLNQLWQGRGGEMPTISLARTTHRTGRLHITKADDWEQSMGATGHTPGQLIHSKFRCRTARQISV